MLLEDRDVQPSLGATPRGQQSCRPSADDGDVAHAS
jgi:hypothetical protein